MKRNWVLALALMSTAPTFSVWAQERTATVVVYELRRTFPDSVKVGIGGLIMTSRGYLFAGAGPGGYVWRSSDYGNTWVNLKGNFGPWAMVNELIETDSGTILAGNPEGIFRSTDNGETWEDVLSAVAWVRSFAKSREGVFAGGSTLQPIFRSTDDGRTWVSICDGLLDSSNVGCLSASQEGRIYMGSAGIGVAPLYDQGEGIFRSTGDGGWQRINRGLPVLQGEIPVQSLANGQSGYVYAGVLGAGIYRSTDYGDHWSPSNGGLSEKYPTALHTYGGAYVFAGFDSRYPNRGGVYLSLDRGDSWTYLGLEKTGIVWSLLFVPDSSFLFVGTHSDGVWRFKLNLVTKVEEVSDVPEAFALNQNYPNPFNPRTTIKFSLPSRSNVCLTVYNALGQEVETLVDEDVPAGTHRATWDASGLPSGIYFVRMNADAFTATKKMVLLR